LTLLWSVKGFSLHEAEESASGVALEAATDLGVGLLLRYSKTLETPSSARTRIERDFDPEAVRQLKTRADRDLTVGGPDLAAQAIKAGLVDEFQLFFVPIVVGGGNQALPDHLRLTLELLDERRFGNGVVHLRYAIRT
jgi:dihydrofolate reductase